MKTSQIDRTIADLEAERAIIEKCCAKLGGHVEAKEILGVELTIISACIARLSGQAEAPKAPRTRKSKKSEVTL